MNKETFRQAVESMFVDDPTRRARRLAALVSLHGYTRATAVIVDDTFLEACKQALLKFAEVADTLSSESGLLVSALPYLLRGLVANAGMFEDFIVAQLIEVSLERGVPITVKGYDKQCDCSVCTAARMANSDKVRH